MSTPVTAAEIMDRSAALMNDPAKTDYTYVAQLPYLNMAIDELVESLEESNAPLTNETSSVISVPIGTVMIPPPPDLVEIQEIGERTAGTQDSFIAMGRHEFVYQAPASSALMFWAFENGLIKFNPNGATTAREIQLKYVRKVVMLAVDQYSIIGVTNARSYLSFKTAAFCAMFIGENESRASILNDQAESALERITGINNKGKQQFATRHRPFRASYKGK